MRSAPLCVLLLASSAWAGPRMDSANSHLVRSEVTGGGGAASSANSSLVGSGAEEVVIMGETSSSNQAVKAGFSEIASFPGTVASLAPNADITTSSATLDWVTPGYDGGLGVAQAGSAYLIQIASASTLGNFANLNAISMSVSTSAQTIGKIVGSGTNPPLSLDPNTTYYAQVFLRDNDGDVSPLYVTDFATFTTLANPPAVGALEFLSVQTTSVTVAWIAPWEPLISSMSNQGYTLMASSDNFGAIVLPAPAPIFSSTTYNSLCSTLTLSLTALGVPLDLSNTYYFQVASLNSVGSSSFTTFTRLNFQIMQSTGFVHFGALDPNVSRSTVATSSMVVTNVGNWPVTIQLTASTATAGGSPWSLGAVPAIETAVLRGIWFTGVLGPPAVGPPATEFTVNGYDTFLSTTPTISSVNALIGNHNYQDNENGVQIPAGGNSTMWFYFTLPTSSVSLGPETMTVQSQPLYP